MQLIRENGSRTHQQGAGTDHDTGTLEVHRHCHRQSPGQPNALVLGRMTGTLHSLNLVGRKPRSD
jgi:hypothetical protein